jgi:aryl-phospho-beta-D-glucosidase BglC (GH1 family)
MGEYVKNGGATAEQAFWSDYYNNSITINGIKSWQSQAEMFRSIINRVDKYNSVLGYEIANEPPIYDNSQYEKLGAAHSFIADKIRSYGSGKFIIFDRAYPVWDSSYIDWNYYSKRLRHQIRLKQFLRRIDTLNIIQAFLKIIKS